MLNSFSIQLHLRTALLSVADSVNRARYLFLLLLLPSPAHASFNYDFLGITPVVDFARKWGVPLACTLVGGFFLIFHRLFRQRATKERGRGNTSFLVLAFFLALLCSAVSIGVLLIGVWIGGWFFEALR